MLISVVDVIRAKELREYIPELSRFQDGTYRCACPIHKGDNPTSFTVFPNNRFYCFACNESGDIIKFVMERDGLNFYEAVDKLADEFGIDTRNDETYKKQITLAEQNGRFIESCLRETDKIKDYLTKKRGFTDEVLTEYKIGYYEKLKAIVIPMVNLYNQPVAFLYRFFDKLPKYKNSKNNELFVKGEFLYNMPNAQRLLRKTKRLYLVEGAFDCMSAYQQGEAAVAYCGITFTKNHVKLIREMTERIAGVQIILVPDNDGKAITKVGRARDLFKTHYPQAEIRVAALSGESKDFNDMLVNGEVISDIETQNIDIFCMYQVLAQQSSVEAQYQAMETYIKSVGNDLIKSDIARLLAKEWGKEPQEVREFLKVAEKANTSEILLEFKDAMQCLNEMEERVLKHAGIMTGIPTFDKSIGGLNLSDVFIIGARAGSGKTMCALEIALHMAVKQRLNVLFFSLEMPAGALYMRIVAKILQVSTARLRQMIENKELDYGLIVDKISKYLKIVDTPGLTMQQIEERIKIANTVGLFDGQVNVVFIDYIQLISGMSEFTEFEKNITGLNPIARRNNVLIVPLTQMNREVKSWQEPDVSQCKGGGSIEQVGNVILLLWRESEDPSLSEIDRQQMIADNRINMVRCKIAKSREGMGEKYFSMLMSKEHSTMRECLA